MKPPRIPGKRVLWIGGRPVVMSDSDCRAFVGGLDGKRKPKLKRAEDKKWKLTAYIAQQARRYFSNPQDQEDARQDAWEAIQKAGKGCNKKDLAHRSIYAKYMRFYRLRKHEA
jgi:hypothetical protein